MSASEPQYLYLTTVGRRSGLPREIEIWFTQHEGRYYVIAEYPSAHWLINITDTPQVTFRVADTTFRGRARLVDALAEPVLHRYVQYLSRQKYGWGEGVVAELAPEQDLAH